MRSAAAAALLIAAPASAATDALPAGAVMIGFAPPVGVPLLYACDAVRTVEGRPLTLASQHELLFA
ncbi:MAG: hypothetical protein ACRCUI_13665, partial [Polymorphobacter sp.]